MKNDSYFKRLNKKCAKSKNKKGRKTTKTKGDIFTKKIFKH